MKSNRLEKEIEKKRAEMTSLAQKYGVRHVVTLSASQELDQLILRFLKTRLKK
ncbi:aspartyl-phosphate phosphatase Spo0E family protein [Bacillus marinisedimentorum]|uniref:aspartyl-phosphate phosphatase Spo0E family protein n=1 Tax=Bacillus marinisedimentorum TaxID=1821260 RepID=UPI000D097A48|nr:aspartyl-phosphate phosphatase Spo0E family protein [Bacillus marinisedimentorum]